MRTIFDPIYPTEADAATAPVEKKPDNPPAGNTTMDAAGLESLRRGDIDTAVSPMTARVMRFKRCRRCATKADGSGGSPRHSTSSARPCAP
jgi:hypothetical protein